MLLAALVVTLTVIAGATPGDAAESSCAGTLQSLVDAATSGGVVEVPACTYREKVTINKPITLQASPEAEIRGSDVWTDWTKSGAYWIEGPLPTFEAHGRCSAGTSRCLWPEQVFFDGEPLEQVASNPKSGQFTVDSDRNVVLVDDPAGHTVEVTTRTGWIMGAADNVTVRGFTMRHSANDAQNGAIENNGYSYWTILDNELSDTHGAVVSLTEGASLNLLDNDIYRGGQLGVHVNRGDVLIRGNRIHDNNTEGFDPSWEAGGMKTAGVLRSGGTHSFTADRNEVYSNKGKGMWCDVECLNPTYSNNRVHHNEGNGIQLEITHGGEVQGNVVWENGWDKTTWGWGAGILSSSSNDVEIRDNVLAWNADGITVVSADRDGTEFDEVKNVLVHHNKILTQDHADEPRHNYALAWLQDWSGVLFAPASNNQGYENKYWYPSPESDSVRYEWERTGHRRLEDFNITPGEENGRYLTQNEKDAVVESQGIPKTGGPNELPIAHPEAIPTRGPPPLGVVFDGTGSSDPDPADPLAYAWYLDSDGAYDEATTPKPTHTYTDPGSYTAGLEVTGSQDTSDTDSGIITAADSTPPDTTIPDVPFSVVKTGSAGFGFSSDDPGFRFQCSLDGAGLDDCTSPKDYNYLASGEHTIRVRTIDAAGYTDSTRAEASWTVDTATSGVPGIDLGATGDSGAQPGTS
jgi:parallel beta-helix repeat protein